MRHTFSRLAAIVVIGLALVGCAAAGAPMWTYSPVSPPPAPAAAATPGQASPAPVQPASARSITIEAFDLGFKPATIAVPASGTFDVTFHNTGATLHNVTFADGTLISADAGATVSGKVTVPVGGSPSCARSRAMPTRG